MPDDGAMKHIQMNREFYERATEDSSHPRRYPKMRPDNNFYGDNPDEDDYFEG